MKQIIRIHASTLFRIRQHRVVLMSNIHTLTHQNLRELLQLGIPTRVQELQHQLTQAKANAKADQADITALIAQPPLAVALEDTATAQLQLVVCQAEPLIDTHTSVSKQIFSYSHA